MLGLMQDRPLLISQIIDYAAAYHSGVEIVSRTVEGPIHRYGYRDAQKRAKKLAEALQGLGIKLGDRVMAHFGELHPEIAAAADLKGPVAAFEVFLDAPPPPKAKATKARAKLVLSAFQPVERDFAFLVDAAIEAEKLVRAARNADKALIAGARVFDLYAGKGVPEGKKSIAIAVTLQPVERTLTDAEIEAVSAKIVAAVTKATGAVLRG